VIRDTKRRQTMRERKRKELNYNVRFWLHSATVWSQRRVWEDVMYKTTGGDRVVLRSG
jgi:hypothetical protein